MTVDMYGVGSFDYVLVRTLEKWSGSKSRFTMTEVEQLPTLSAGGTKRQVRLESNDEAYEEVFRSMANLPEMKALRFLGTLPEDSALLWEELSVFEPETRRRLYDNYAFRRSLYTRQRWLDDEPMRMEAPIIPASLDPMDDDDYERVVVDIVAKYFLDVLDGIRALGY